MSEASPVAAANGAINELRGQVHAALDRCANLAARIAELEVEAAAAEKPPDDD
tara:strand:- start:607 stop:765 length:159 start_codon:yes stop_codon:yes gene_type:complete